MDRTTYGRILAVLATGLLSGGAAAYQPSPFRPPPPECLALLDLYSAGTTTVSDLRPVLRVALTPPWTNDIPIKFLLYAGIHAGVVTRENITEALALEGCAEKGNGACFEIRALVAAGPGRPESFQTFSQARDDLLDSVTRWGQSNLNLDAAYMSALVRDCQLSLADVVTILVTGAPPETAGMAVMEAYSVFASVSPWGFRGAAARAFAGRIRDHSVSGLLEVRALSPEALQTLWETMDRFWPPLLDSRTTCLVERLRQRPVVPDRWQVEKDRLICDGLF